MKQFILTITLLLSALTAGAQDIETMTAVYVNADPMTKAQGSTKWKSQHVAVTLWDDGRVGMGLINPPNIFIGGRDFMGNYKLMNTCKVGLYAQDGTLVWLAEKWKCQPGEGGTVLYFVGKAKSTNHQTGEKKTITTTDILEWLRKQGQYVRYIADIYGDYYLDISAKFE